MFDFDWHPLDFLEQKTGQARHKRVHKPMKDRDSIHSIHHWSKLVFPTDLGKRPYWFDCAFVGRSRRQKAIRFPKDSSPFDFHSHSHLMAKATRNWLPQEDSHQEVACLVGSLELW